MNTVKQVTDAKEEILYIPRPFIEILDPIQSGVGDFLSRDICIYHSDDFASLGNMEFLVIHDFMHDSKIQSKLKHFRYLRGNLRITFVFSAETYACGSYVTGFKYGGAKATISTAADDKYNLITCHHNIVDISRQTRSVIDVPVGCLNNYVHISDGDDPDKKHRIVVAQFTQVQNVMTNATPKITLHIYAHMTESHVKIPVYHDLEYTMEIQEVSHNDGIISKPLAVATKTLRDISEIPFIGPFAKATSLVTEGVGQIATLLGFSRPRRIDHVNAHQLEALASTTAGSFAKSLTIEEENEVTLNLTSRSVRDVLSFSKTVQLPGIVAHTYWDSEDSIGSSLMEIAVNPSLVLPFYPVKPTPVAYFSQLFAKWRGTLVYDIYLNSNMYVKGQLRVVYSPNKITLPVDYHKIIHTLNSTVIDVQEAQLVTVSIPMSQNSPYLKVDMMHHDAQFFEGHNGYIYILVASPLRANNPLYQLNIVVTVRAHDDFELAVPHTEFIDYLHPLDGVAITGNSTVPTYDDISNILHADGDQHVVTSKLNYTMDIDETQVVERVILPINENITDAYIGDKHFSLRLLLKSYWYYGATVIPAGYTGFMLGDYPATTPYYTSGTPKRNYIHVCPLSYIGHCFQGYRGSIRWSVLKPTTFSYTWFACRDWGYCHGVYKNVNNADGYNDDGNGIVAPIQQFGLYEPVAWDTPYQDVTNYKEIPILDSITMTRCTKVITGNAMTLRFFNSVGEDFDFVCWNGIPQLYQWKI